MLVDDRRTLLIGDVGLSCLVGLENLTDLEADIISHHVSRGLGKVAWGPSSLDHRQRRQMDIISIGLEKVA